MIYLNSSAFKELKGENLKIGKIYWPYRSGGLKVGWKFIFKSFKPDVNGRMCEVVFKKGEKPSLVPYEGKIDKEFFNTYKKVFDVSFQLEKEKVFTNYKWETVKDKEITIQGLGSSKVQNIILATILDEAPTKEDGSKEYNWEDWIVNNLEGKVVKFGMTGKGLETRYNFKQTTFNEDQVVANTIEDLAF